MESKVKQKAQRIYSKKIWAHVAVQCGSNEKKEGRKRSIRTKFQGKVVKYNIRTRVSARRLRHVSKVRSPLTISRRACGSIFRSHYL